MASHHRLFIASRAFRLVDLEVCYQVGLWLLVVMVSHNAYRLIFVVVVFLGENEVHYKNGREAKNGDKVLLIPEFSYGVPVVGILYDAVAGNDTCNGRIAAIHPSDPCPNLKECLHVDDAKEMLK